MKKKIGIITLPLNTNYGGIIQAYALQTVIEKMGFDVYVLDTPRYKFPIDNKSLYLKRFIKKIIRKYKRSIFLEKEYYNSYPIVAQNTEIFIQRYIHRMKILDLSCVNVDDFYGFVVGSDQIWRPSYFRYIEDAYLGFLGNANVKRIAYAPSIGIDDWEYSDELTETCSLLLKKFDAVSLREDSAVTLFAKYMGCNSEHVLDPTFLLNREDYVKLYQNEIGLESHKSCLLTYLLDPIDEYRNIIDKIKQFVGGEVFCFNKQTEDYKIKPLDRVALPVEAWFKAFDDAKFVVTDSFHACVFSIIFHKPFIVLVNRYRGGARIKSLLRIFKLENRIVSNSSDISNIDCDGFDWDEIDKIMKKWQDKSFFFLSNALNL